MAEHRCSTCVHFRWALGPTGRRRPTQAGNCAWTFPWPDKWPKAYIRNWFPSKPAPARMWPQDGYDCLAWQDTREEE